MKKRLLYSALVTFFWLTPLLYAEEQADDFATLLEEASEIATKNSLNIDYLPSVVTVINAETFRTAGITNLAEALDMLPGFQIQRNVIGYNMTTVRGFKNPNAYLSDKIKIMLDGVPVHNETSGSSHMFLDFPLELVKKIEVLRGPASSLYGAGSLYGTINIITKLGSRTPINRLHLSGGSYSHFSAGTNVHEQIGSWNFFADGYYLQNDKQVYAKVTEHSGTFNTGEADNALKNYTVGFRLDREHWAFSTRLKANRAGNGYSFEGKFNPIPERNEGHGSSFLLSNLSYNKTINDIKLNANASYTHREVWLDANLIDVNKILSRFSKIDVTDMREGLYIEEETHEENAHFELTAEFPEYYANSLLVGSGVEYTTVSKDNYYNSIENYIAQHRDEILAHPNYEKFKFNEYNEPGYWNNPTTSKLQDNVERTNLYAYLQDLIALTPNLDLTLGLRADHYSDFGLQLSQRAALVYRASDETIFKLLYGSAFRAPSFVEAYSNGHIYYRQGYDDIKPEHTDTYEAVLILKPNYQHRFMINYFYSILDNVIDLEEDPTTPTGYMNYDKRVSQGIEAEYNYKWPDKHELYLNATYIDAQYSTFEEEKVEGAMPDISRIMFKGVYIYHPSTRLGIGTAWRYFGDTTSSDLPWVIRGERQTSVKAFHVFDETVTFALNTASLIRFSVKNIFNADVRDPSYYYRYDSGIPREGSEVFIEYEASF